MARYIDAVSKAKVLETYAELYDVFDDYKEIKKELHKVYDKLNALPTADVVEVVRCKDCKYLDVLNGNEFYARCKQNGRLFDSFGNQDTRVCFCESGERMKGEEDV